MPPYVYYDRRSVTTTEQQFFHESRGVHADKEIGTNMEKNLQFPVDITIKKIGLVLPPKLLSTTTARDTTLDDQVQIFLNEAVLEIQVGDGPIQYFPVLACLVNVNINIFGHYTLATAADGSYALINVGAGNGKFGLDVEIAVPANTDFKFYLKTKTTPAFGTVTALLFVEK